MDSKKENRAILESGLPKRFTSQLTDEIMLMVEKMGDDAKMDSTMAIDNILDFIPAVKDISGVSLKRYMDALRFIFIKRNCDTALEAWKTCFREKWWRLEAMGKERDANSYASSYNKTKLVSTLEAATMVAFSIQYSHFRHIAMKKEFDLMNGKASISYVPRYMKDSSGKLMLENGHKQYECDMNGEVLMDPVYQVVTPLVQHQAAMTILEITKPAEENDITINVGITDEAIAINTRIAESIEAVAENQRKGLLAGKSINEVQQIGDIIEAKLVMGGDDDE